jgi:hypothetical protein
LISTPREGDRYVSATTPGRLSRSTTTRGSVETARLTKKVDRD